MFVAPPPQSRTNSISKNSSRPTRVYQAWKGSNKFFICGRLIFGPDVRSLVVTLFLIIVPVVIFCVFVASRLENKFPHNHGVAIVIVTTVYTFFVLVLLLLTSSRDPGILPRNAHPPEPEEDFDVANSPTTEFGHAPATPRYRLPRTKDVIVNGVSVKIKYCDTCMLYRPPRCSHCSICNNCVQRFDHHCPWVGQCIGLRNYRYFFMFVSSTTLLCIFVFGICALNIKILMRDHSYTVWRAMGKSPPSVLLMAYTFIAVWFVGGLTFFHLYLISTNQTTYENFRYRYDNKVNPYNRGLFRNFQEVLCSSVANSLNNFRAKVQADGSLPPSTNLQNLQVQHQQAAAKPRSSEASKDVESGPKSTSAAWPHPLIDEAAFADLHSRVSNVDVAAVESMAPKDGFEEMFPGAFGRMPAMESGMHPRRSSWGRKSGNWEITPDLLGGSNTNNGNAAAGENPGAAEGSPSDNPGTR